MGKFVILGKQPSLMDAYGIAASTADSYAGDFFDFPVGAQVDGQLGKDEQQRDGILGSPNLAAEVKDQMTSLFFDHVLIAQMKNDMWYERISERRLQGIKGGFQCTDPIQSSYIPSSSEKDIS